jgi:uracil-DNA glycosylase family 4
MPARSLIPLSPFYNIIRSCTRCSLIKTCNAPVPGHGPTTAKIMFVGEYPGEDEDYDGVPFQGAAGQYLDSLIEQAGLHREDCFVTNIVKCHPPGNRNLMEEELSACVPWLDMEIAAVEPYIIVALGAFATHYLLKDTSLSMDYVSGRPFIMNAAGWIPAGNAPGYGPLVLPIYHPAAPLHLDPSGGRSQMMRRIQEGFQVLKSLVDGADPHSFWVTDRYAGTEMYHRGVEEVLKSFLDVHPIFALDTETINDELWSVQVSAQDGTGLFFYADVWNSVKPDLSNHTVIVHNYLYDSQYIDMPNFIDTQVAAYLLGLPQGLKDLSSRYCGMEMQSYREMVRPYRLSKSLQYLTKASETDWGKPDLIPVTEWSDKKGQLITRNKRPQRINLKINKALKNAAPPSNKDPYEYWQGLDPREYAVIEDVLGSMEDASLEDIPFDKALFYSCRDPDATWRLWHALEPKLKEEGLLPLFHSIELPTQVLARKMMDNGVPVDVEYLKPLAEEIMVSLNEDAIRCAELAGDPSGPMPFNPNGTKTVADVIYGTLEFPPTKLTETGLISTDDAELKKIDHPVIPHILGYRQKLKLLTTYIEPLSIHGYVREGLGLMPRINSTIRTTRTETGRWSMGDPLNLQNIPILRARETCPYVSTRPPRLQVALPGLCSD